MRKMPTLFVRDFTKHAAIARDEVTLGCEWVLAGEGVATRKLDGTCCRIVTGPGCAQLFKRYDAKHGKTPPVDFEPAQEAPDPVTGHWPGWVPITPSDRYHHEAFKRSDLDVRDGTYELCGPRVNGNPEQLSEHRLIRHGSVLLASAYPLSFDGLRAYLDANVIEGIVWHHPDGRMAKLKRSDFGFPWPVRLAA